MFWHGDFHIKITGYFTKKKNHLNSRFGFKTFSLQWHSKIISPALLPHFYVTGYLSSETQPFISKSRNKAGGKGDV